MKSDIFKIIIKILKNLTSNVQLAVKVEKSNCKSLQSRNKQIEIKHALFKVFDYSFEYRLK